MKTKMPTHTPHTKSYIRADSRYWPLHKSKFWSLSIKWRDNKTEYAVCSMQYACNIVQFDCRRISGVVFSFSDEIANRCQNERRSNKMTKICINVVCLVELSTSFAFVRQSKYVHTDYWHTEDWAPYNILQCTQHTLKPQSSFFTSLSSICESLFVLQSSFFGHIRKWSHLIKNAESNINYHNSDHLGATSFRTIRLLQSLSLSLCVSLFFHLVWNLQS